MPIRQWFKWALKNPQAKEISKAETNRLLGALFELVPYIRTVIDALK
jgi:hypothetical protein